MGEIPPNTIESLLVGSFDGLNLIASRSKNINRGFFIGGITQVVMNRCPVRRIESCDIGFPIAVKCILHIESVCMSQRQQAGFQLPNIFTPLSKRCNIIQNIKPPSICGNCQVAEIFLNGKLINRRRRKIVFQMNPFDTIIRTHIQTIVCSCKEQTLLSRIFFYKMNK